MFYAWCMRTTLTIDTDVLNAARGLAAHSGHTLGQVISDLARQSLMDSKQPASSDTFFGFAPLPPRGAVVSNDLVNALRDEEGV